MSKIQDALSKIQKSNKTSKPRRPSPSEHIGETQSNSVLSESAIRRAAYGGRHIVINRRALRDSGLMAPEDHSRQVADEYRQIKRPLIRNARSSDLPLEHGNLIMVASAMSGEGKSFNCINLALSMSLERDLEVLLIDGDVAKPHISTIMGAAGEPGLLDLLEKDAPDAHSLVMPTDIPGLSILPAGKQSEHATELLASRRMRELADELSQYSANRIVLFDSPPVLMTSEAQVLASAVGQIALVVKAGTTSRQAVANAVSKLDTDKPINVILNQTTLQDAGQTYGYGYGYGSTDAQDAREAS